MSQSVRWLCTPAARLPSSGAERIATAVPAPSPQKTRLRGPVGRLSHWDSRMVAAAARLARFSRIDPGSRSTVCITVRKKEYPS